ncbi:MAG: Tad domain-containing protein [Candidatus Dormibacteria bacterium]
MPLFALLLVVITGFVALDLDSGIAYDQSRTDQDVSDAAALAATYWIWSNVNDQTLPSVSGAFTAAVNVAELDCTGPSAPCSLSLAFYGNTLTWTPSTAMCSASVQNVSTPTPVTWTPSGCSPVITTVYYAGASVGSTGHTYIGAAAFKSGSFSVGNQAVAQVVGGTGGTGEGSLYLNCVLCILGGQNGADVSSGVTEGLTIESNSDLLDLTSDDANMDINRGLDCEGSNDAATIDTTKGGGTPYGAVDVAGTYTDNCGSSGAGLTWKPASTTSPNNPSVNTAPIADPLINMSMPLENLANCPNGENYGNTYDNITVNTTLHPGCYENIVINGSIHNSSAPSGGQSCLNNGDGVDVIFDAGTYIIYGNPSPSGPATAGGLTIEGVNPSVESDDSTAYTNSIQGLDCKAGGVTLDFVCSTTAGGAPAYCNAGGEVGAGLVLDASAPPNTWCQYDHSNSTQAYETAGNSQTDNAMDANNSDLTCDYQWNLFPPETGQQENLGIIFDRNNQGWIETASQTPDGDSDHNGAIYAPAATYVMANYGTSGPVEGSGNSCTTPLGAPMIVDYMQVYANYNQTWPLPSCHEFDWYETFTFDLNNDVQLNGGGPGGLSG